MNLLYLSCSETDFLLSSINKKPAVGDRQETLGHLEMKVGGFKMKFCLFTIWFHANTLRVYKHLSKPTKKENLNKLH